MKPWMGSAPLAWLAAVGSIAAVLWPHFFDAEIPLVGLRSLAVPSVGWPLGVGSFAMAVFLSFPTVATRDRLLVCAGVALCLFGVLVIYVSPVYAGVFAFIAGNIIRETKHVG
jgi:hypothetical protein